MVRMNQVQKSKVALLLACSVMGSLMIGCSSSGNANIGDGELTVDRSALSSYAAEWTGYIEAYTFMSGSDRVRVTLDEQGNGWLQVGAGDVLPPPTDPNIGWPPVLTNLDPGTRSLDPDKPLDGIRYPIQGARVESERIRFTIDPFDAFTTWCEMQTPLLHANEVPAGYGCTSAAVLGLAQGTNQCTTGNDNDGNPIIVDCAKAALCFISVCACDQTACTSGTGQTVSLDAALDDDGGSLVGSILMPGETEGTRTIRLKRP